MSDSAEEQPMEPKEYASCQCGWQGAPEDRRTQWGKRAYCPICGNEAPIRPEVGDDE